MTRLTSDTLPISEAGPPRPDLLSMRPATAALDEARLVEAARQLHCRALGGGQPPQGGACLGPGAVVLFAGTPALLAEADATDIRLETAPSPSNGWRSLTTVPTLMGRDLTVEMVAAPRVTPAPEERAREAGSFGPETMRARALKRLGATDRAQSARSEPEPTRLVTVATGTHCDADGVLFPGAVLDLMQSTERLLHLGGPHAPSAHLRRLHLFEAVTPGEVLGVATLLSRGAFPAPSSQSLRSVLRRLADGRIVALCDTVLR